ncbi:hypothetical protein ACX0G9_05390 [Flavitalea flava]
MVNSYFTQRHIIRHNFLLRCLSIFSIVLVVCLFSRQASGQELFVYTEPASNMPAKSIGIRASNWFMNGPGDPSLNYRFIPEVMWGANKNLMLHTEGFFSNTNQSGKTGQSFHGEGLGLYGKYRFYTSDQVYRHFRLAGFGRISTNNSRIQQEQIDINGYNAGYQFGMIATQLLHKQAISSSISFVQALDNGNKHPFPSGSPDKAIQASLSTGRLLLPRNYTGYNQTNFNVMLELLGEHLVSSNKAYLDIAPAIQFIFNSQTRLDFGYRRELYSNMTRMSQNGFMIRIEHLLFNVL